MSDFEINLTGVEETGSFDLMPVGDYEFVATAWENKTSAKGSAYLQITFDVTGPTHSGRKISAFGLEQLEGMLNIPFKASVKVEPGGDKGDGSKWDDKNRINRFLSAGATAPKSAPSQSPTKKAESSDDGFDWDK